VQTTLIQKKAEQRLKTICSTNRLLKVAAVAVILCRWVAVKRIIAACYRRQQMTLTGSITFSVTASTVVWLCANLTWRRTLARYAAAAVIGNLLFLATVLSPRIALAFTAASIIALVVLKLVQPRKPVRPMPMKYRLPGE
jgi:hypothetical protein